MDAIMYMPRVVGSDEKPDADVLMTVNLRLSNLTAAVPLSGDSNISYLNAALVILAFVLWS
jgi:hypothetical protein